jgi:hypothetical protein
MSSARMRPWPSSVRTPMYAFFSGSDTVAVVTSASTPLPRLQRSSARPQAGGCAGRPWPLTACCPSKLKGAWGRSGPTPRCGGIHVLLLGPILLRQTARSRLAKVSHVEAISIRSRRSAPHPGAVETDVGDEDIGGLVLRCVPLARLQPACRPLYPRGHRILRLAWRIQVTKMRRLSAAGFWKASRTCSVILLVGSLRREPPPTVSLKSRARCASSPQPSTSPRSPSRPPRLAVLRLVVGLVLQGEFKARTIGRWPRSAHSTPPGTAGGRAAASRGVLKRSVVLDQVEVVGEAHVALRDPSSRRGVGPRQSRYEGPFKAQNLSYH